MPKQCGGTCQIKVNPTKILDHQSHPVLVVINYTQGLHMAWQNTVIHLGAFDEFVARLDGAHAEDGGHLVPLLLPLQRHRTALVTTNL